jgi:DNA-binding transcriptional regulator YiaG
MDPLDRAVIEERIWIKQSQDVAALLDRMAEYRETARAAEQAGNDRAVRRIGDLLELAEERVIDLKAAKLRGARGPALGDHAESRPRPDRVAPTAPSEPGPEEQLRAARAELAATTAAHRAAVLAREAAARRERDAAEEREAKRAAERERQRREERQREAQRLRVADERRGAGAPRAEEDHRIAERSRIAASLPVKQAPPPATLPSPVASASPAKPAPHGTPGSRGQAPSLPAPTPASGDTGRAASAAEEPPAYTGADLAALRRSSGLAQGAFAAELGVTQGTVSKAEGTPSAVLGPALRLAMWKRKRNEPG